MVSTMAPSPESINFSSQANSPLAGHRSLDVDYREPRLRFSAVASSSMAGDGNAGHQLSGEEMQLEMQLEIDRTQKLVRSFARWAVGSWDVLKQMFRRVTPPEQARLSVRPDLETARKSFIKIKQTKSDFKSIDVHADADAKEEVSGFESHSNISGTSGSRRLSGVAGAGASAPVVASQSSPSKPKSFAQGLRDATTPPKTQKPGSYTQPIVPHFKPVAQAQWVRTLKQNGFDDLCAGGAVQIFKEIQKEKRADAKAAGLGISPVETITHDQLCAFEKQPVIIMASLAELLKLNRSSTLRAWRLDIDIQGIGLASRADFVRCCEGFSFGDQAKFLFDSYRPVSPEDSQMPLTFEELDPDEFANLSVLAEALLMMADWDTEQAWEYLDIEAKGMVDYATFLTMARKILGHFPSLSLECDELRLIFEGLDASNQGRLWRDEFAYIWLVTLPRLQEKFAVEKPSVDVTLGSHLHQAIFGCGDVEWEPSQNEQSARAFARWAAAGRWSAIYEVFDEEARNKGVRKGNAEFTPSMVYRWLDRLNFTGEVAPVFMEISREKSESKNASNDGYNDVLSISQLVAFRRRRNRICLKEFNEHLMRRRGSALQAWKLDLDAVGSGLIDQNQFIKASKRIGFGDDILCVVDGVVMHSRDKKRPIHFDDISPDEAANMRSFAEELLERADWNVDDAWSFIDTDDSKVIKPSEFELFVEHKIIFEGDTDLLFNGLATNASGLIWQEDFQYLWTLLLLEIRRSWRHPPARELSAMEQYLVGGPFKLMAQLGLDRNGLMPNGNELKPGQLVTRLEHLGYWHNSMRAATELFWKVTQGYDADDNISSKGLLLKTNPAEYAETEAARKWNPELLRTYHSKAALWEKGCYAKSGTAGDLQAGMRRRLCEWHTNNNEDRWDRNSPYLAGADSVHDQLPSQCHH